MRQGEARINPPLCILAWLYSKGYSFGKYSVQIWSRNGSIGYKRHHLHVSGEQGSKMKTLMAKPGYLKLRSKMMSMLYMLVAGVNQP
jgi:hypothetical protein